YNVKRVIRIHELDQRFKATFGYWPANPKEPLLVDMEDSQFVGWTSKKSIKTKSPPCSKRERSTMFKTREVDNRMGNQFAGYVSLALTNCQTYVIDTTTLMAKE
uniref:Uncharacterized protein n=1 Tax=Romanomermis culicivorax TaxID=13658 RepID=A0A915HH52_ROMCU